MFDKRKTIEARYEEMTSLLGDGGLQAHADRYRAHSKALSEIRPVVERFRDYKAVESAIGDAREFAGADLELRELAERELVELEARRDDLLRAIRVLIAPKDPNDEKNVVLEIRAGTGGDEAGLFAHDLWRMYRRFAERMGWKVEILPLKGSGAGAVKEVIARARGSTAGSSTKAASTVCSGCRRRRRAAAFIPRPRPSRCSPRPGRWTSPSSPGTCASTRLLDRARRPACQHHPLGGAHHPPADRPRGFPSRTRSRKSRTERRP